MYLLSSNNGVKQPAVVLLGGEANALSIARELGRQGIRVFALSSEETCVRHSRYCQWLALPPGGREDGDGAAAGDPLLRFLLAPQTQRLAGSLLIACDDAALRTLARHRAELLERYRLDLAHPSAQLAMLDKLRTYEIARSAGVATPQFWFVDTREQALALRDKMVFPLMVKPRLSHVFERRFGRKHVIVASFDELLSAFDAASAAGVSVMLVEVIPGPDEQLSSYFTYIDESGDALCHYTKRVLRRYPVGMGAGCYHISGDVPQIVAPSLRLLAAAGVRGIANVEFKYDQRDGRHKLIECNARFVASNALVAAGGLKLATFVYDRAVGGRATLPAAHATRTMRMWDPMRDFAAFLQLRRAGKITLWQWLASIMHRQSFPYFRWFDPGPSLSRMRKGLRRALPIRCKG